MFGQPWYRNYPPNVSYNPYLHNSYQRSSPFESPAHYDDDAKERLRALAERRARRAQWLPDEVYDDNEDDYDDINWNYQRRKQQEALQRRQAFEAQKRLEEQQRQEALSRMEEQRRREELRRLEELRQEELHRKIREEEEARQRAEQQRRRSNEKLKVSFLKHCNAFVRLISSEAGPTPSSLSTTLHSCRSSRGLIDTHPSSYQAPVSPA